MFFDNVLDVIIGIVFSLFFTLLGFILVFNNRELYYHDIDMLDIEQEVDMDKETIKDNYDQLIDYCQPTNKDELVFSDFVSSKQGLSHFEDVKGLIKALYITTCILGVICCFIIFMKGKYRDIQYLFLSSISVVVIPILTGLYLLYDFDRAFEAFHKLLFDNNYWMFDEYNDPIINILPDKYFMHCGVAILCFSAICGLCLFVVYKGLCKKYLAEEAAK